MSWHCESKSCDKGKQLCFSEIATESPDAADKQMPYISSNVVEDFYLTDTVTGMLVNVSDSVSHIWW
jgi:hypothetical protein